MQSLVANSVSQLVELRRKIARAWADIHRQTPDEKGNFLLDGGDSIHGFELLLALEEELNLKPLPIEIFFEYPTPGDMAAALLAKFPDQLRGNVSSS